MSKHNIVAIAPVRGGCVVTFETDKGRLRSYKYGKVAARKIVVDQRNPAEFKAQELKPTK